MKGSTLDLTRQVLHEPELDDTKWPAAANIFTGGGLMGLRAIPPTTQGGIKHDTGKLRYDLIPPYPMALVAEVYTIGARKYADRNWEKGIAWARIFRALLGHAWAWFLGEKHDPKDGQHHLASVVWCALALMEFEVTHKELDDRPLYPALLTEMNKLRAKYAEKEEKNGTK